MNIEGKKLIYLASRDEYYLLDDELGIAEKITLEPSKKGGFKIIHSKKYAKVTDLGNYKYIMTLDEDKNSIAKIYIKNSEDKNIGDEFIVPEKLHNIFENFRNNKKYIFSNGHSTEIELSRMESLGNNMLFLYTKKA